jgi:hypothetical protein
MNVRQDHMGLLFPDGMPVMDESIVFQWWIHGVPVTAYRAQGCSLLVNTAAEL